MSKNSRDGRTMLAQLDIQHIRSKYRDRMLHIAFTVSGWSAEPEGQRHGAVLAAEGRYVVATGFNGPDRSWRPPAWTWRPTKREDPPLVHAELNALINLGMVGVDPSRCLAFVTKKPCPPCMQALQGAGIPAIMWMQDVGEDRGQWVRSNA